MAPPVRQSQSWGGLPSVAPGAKIPEVFPSSETTAPSGSRAPSAWHAVWAVSGPVGSPGKAARARTPLPASPPAEAASAASPASTSSAGPTRWWTVHPSGTRSLRLPG